MTQTDLPLFVSRERSASKKEVEKLIGLLSRCSDFVAAAFIKDTLGWSDRKTRSVASQSDGRIVSTDLGYKLTCKCNPEEMTAFRARIKAQADKMLARLAKTELCWHRRKAA